MKNTERFSNRVDNYVKYRPHYPEAIIPYLKQHAGLKPGGVVADIGVGTGISSLLFLENGNTVLGVEPNEAMRLAAENQLGNNTGFKVVNGSAEHTTLPDNCADLIIAGQAFHWFNRAEARAEFRRIGRENAMVALIWNERLTDTPFEAAFEQLLKDYAVDYIEVDHRNIGPEQLAEFFSEEGFVLQLFKNAQFFDYAGLKGRLLSSSYAPEPGHKNYAPMLEKLESIFGKYNEQRIVKFHYTTRLYLGRV
ncbi:class I SAM-dependent methyltransferase [uncultured Chitinophaga sp.]|uniref:class I SAM-dependent methyltransferase n=1 Tax=uncultured Chitinophaga sp. TaxID=339340 RepID=UPI0025DF3FAC|nr:class I SAM-dependent methyltransferase [uncultured Chitinophaga sp.]